VTANAQTVNLPGNTGCWSKATNRFVVASDKEGGPDQIYFVDASSGEMNQVSHFTDKRAWEPSMSPDEQWITFEAHGLSEGDHGSIWKVRSDGTMAKQLTPSSVDAKQPNWSPKGDRIVYQAKGTGGAADIFSIDTEGGSVINVTNSTSE